MWLRARAARSDSLDRGRNCGVIFPRPSRIRRADRCVARNGERCWSRASSCDSPRGARKPRTRQPVAFQHRVPALRARHRGAGAARQSLTSSRSGLVAARATESFANSSRRLLVEVKRRIRRCLAITPELAPKGLLMSSISLIGSTLPTYVSTLCEDTI